MANKQYAGEWLAFSKKNIDTARLLFDARHYEDIIGVELQQSLEKLLKSILAYQNIKIPREHDLLKLYFMIGGLLDVNDDEVVLLKIATNYYKEDRYPNPNYLLPLREEIKEVLGFTERLFDKVCDILDIDKSWVTHK